MAKSKEKLKDHASDSNHKKCVGMVSHLCGSYQHAIDMLEHAQSYHRNLTDEAGTTAVEKWMEDIKKAETIRRQDVKVMEIYAAKLAGSPITFHSSTAPQ